MTQPTVSIIVPTFNRAHYLPECLDSLVAQTVPPLEIIVVDDGSEDATREVVARYAAPVRYIYKENGGKSTAVNLALGQCRGDLIWLFDDDDVALPDAIEHRLEALANSPEAGFVYSAHYVGMDGPEGKIERGQLYVPQQPTPESFLLEIMKSCFFHLNSALVRRTLYSAVGGFDSALKTGEDYDIQIRLARVASPAFSTHPSFIFRQHQGARGDKTTRYKVDERRRMFMTYSAALGRKVREQVSLIEFLNTDQRGICDNQTVRIALLNRAVVMANFGCISEMVEDVSLLLEKTIGNIPVSTTELKQLEIAMTTGFAYEATVLNWREFIGMLNALEHNHAGKNKVIWAFAKGMLRLAKSHAGDISERAAKVWHAVRLMM